MLNKKFHFVFDKTNKINKKKIKFLKKYKNYPPHKADTIIVLGGDGFMLQILKKLRKLTKLQGLETLMQQPLKKKSLEKWVLKE